MTVADQGASPIDQNTSIEKASTEKTNPESAEDKRVSDKLTIIGIGASAGGLTPLRTFFAAIPADTSMTFVVVVHLSPDHESIL